MSAAEHKDEGTRHFKAKQYAEAARSYTRAIELESDPVELAKLLGNRSTSYGLLQKHLEALSDAKRALQQDPKYLKGYYRQATALMSLSRFAEAAAAAAEGLRHEPGNRQLQQLLQEAKAKAPQSSSDMGDDSDDLDDDDLDDGEEDEDDDMEEEDDDDDEPMAAAPPTPVLSQVLSPAEQAEQRKEAGNVLYKQGDYDGAVRLYTSAIQAAPTNPAYLLNRAAALLMLHRAADALVDAQASLALDATLKAHARVAKCLLQLGRFSDARRQLEAGADLPNAQATLAPEYATLGELESLMRNGKSALAQEGGAAAREALRCFGALAERCQQSLVIACLQMEACLRASPERGASQVVSESARWMRKPGGSQEPALLCVRGKALYGIGQLEDALKHFSEALKLDPDHSSSRQMRNQIKELERLKRMGNEAFSAGNFAEAEAQYSEALQSEGGLPADVKLTLLTNRATARFRARKFDGSLEDCDAALAIKPGHVKALLRRAAVYMEIENWKAAIAAYEAAQEADPDDRNIAQGLRQAKLELKKSLRKDLYKVLGIDKRADDREIKKGYKMAAMKCHPDRHASGTPEEKAKAEQQFKEVGEAFEILSDPEKKQRYDQGEDVEEINGSGGGGRGPGGMSQADIFNMFNAQGGFGGMGGMGGMPRGSRGGGFHGFPGAF